MTRFAFRRLSCALALAVFSVPVMAAEPPKSHDDRWYLTLGAGANHQDNSRDTENVAFGAIGVGKFIGSVPVACWS